MLEKSSNELKVAKIQTELFWEDPGKNRRQFQEKISEFSEAVDLIVLPEMFTSGFTMNAEKVAESMQGTTVNWMKQLAKSTNAAITGSIVIKEKGSYFNRLLFVAPDGSCEYYDKKHRFTLAGEQKVYSAGKTHKLIEYRGWKILPLICYDLRFPVWARNTMDYDLLLYVANWPKVRISAWDILLQARAIENMCYCIGVNRIGKDGNGHEYSGHTAAYDVLGKILNDLTEKESETIVILEKSEIRDLRAKLGFLEDRDNFTLE